MKNPAPAWSGVHTQRIRVRRRYSDEAPLGALLPAALPPGEGAAAGGAGCGVIDEPVVWPGRVFGEFGIVAGGVVLELFAVVWDDGFDAISLVLFNP
ncbi:hypothetical protein [Afipia carboxidovorans]|uniref:hypothetical protein n=1 Tax=Afipia carboxidovorans TaxID=40137 RepID=UPI00130546CF|nr:hypothetical protein [Afipia carboxidovorans]